MQILKSKHLNILRSIILSSFLFSFLSCSKNASALSDDKLAQVIADMHISEIALKRHDLHLQDSLTEVYLAKLEQIHTLERDMIKREVEELMQDRKRQSAVYTKVITILQDLEKEVKKDKDPQDKYKSTTKNNG